MPLHPDDPRLTAHLLGELSADESAEVARAAAADPALGLALRQLEGLQRTLTATLAPAQTALFPHQREHILRAARQRDAADRVVSLPAPRRPWKSYLMPVAAAALVALATFIFIKLPKGADHDLGSAKPTDPATWDRAVPLEIALLPAPGPPDTGAGQATGTAANQSLAAQAAARDTALTTTGEAFLRKVADRLRQSPAPPADMLPRLTPRSPVTPEAQPLLPLPIHAGRASLGWITHAVRSEHRLPAANAVRLEEIINSFDLRPAGDAGVAAGASVASESLVCSWKPSATLLIIVIRGAADGPREVTAAFRPDPAGVARYRLLGFAPVAGIPAGALPGRLPAKTVTTLAIEIEPADNAGALGTIEWSVDGKPAPTVPVARHGAEEPSDDARFGALACTFAQWLTREQPDLIDPALVSALSRECAAPTLPPARADFLTLVAEALALAR
jgi:hypothetical protein